MRGGLGHIALDARRDHAEEPVPNAIAMFERFANYVKFMAEKELNETKKKEDTPQEEPHQSSESPESSNETLETDAQRSRPGRAGSNPRQRAKLA